MLPVPENECTGDVDCPNEKACANRVCVDVCSIRGVCGENALCQPLKHKPTCSCPQCYIGDPHKFCSVDPDPKCRSVPPLETEPRECLNSSDCSDKLACSNNKCIDPCLLKTTQCDKYKKCDVRNHQPVCVCKSGFIVNELGELSCAPDKIECHSDSECASNLACIQGRCQSPCSLSLCPANKTCAVLNHLPVCLCIEDCHPSVSICLRDNGCPPHLACFNFKCIDPCGNTTCPQNAPCIVEDHKPVCKFCPKGYIPDKKYGCLKGKIIFTVTPNNIFLLNHFNYFK